MGHGDDDSMQLVLRTVTLWKDQLSTIGASRGGAGKGGLSVSSTLGSISVFPPMLSAFNAELADYGLQ